MLPPDETAPGGKFSHENFKSWVLSTYPMLEDAVKEAIINSASMYETWTNSGGTSIFAEANKELPAGASNKEGEVDVPVGKLSQLQQSADKKRERDRRERDRRERDRRNKSKKTHRSDRHKPYRRR